MKKTVLTDFRVSGKCVSGLEALGFAVIRLPSFWAISEPVSAHPDMLVYKLSDDGSELLLHRDYYECAKDVLSSLGVKIKLTSEPVGDVYPNDILLNGLRVKDTVYARKASISRYISSGAARVVDVRQGYAACSVSMLSDTAAVTADKSMKSALEANGITVLLIRPGYIVLDGYDYGFIGGCGGRIGRDRYAFFGNIDLHPDGDIIKDFAASNGVSIVSLSDEPLHDHGGMVVIEKA